MLTVTVLMDGYWTRPDPLKLRSRTAKVARRLRSRTPTKLYVYDTLLGWCSHYYHYPCLWRQNRDRGGRRVEGAEAVRAPVRPAKRCMRMVSRASWMVSAGRMVARCRASLDVPAPGGPMPRRPPAHARDALARLRTCASYDPIRLDEEGWGKSSGPGLQRLEGGAQLENRGPPHTTRGSGGVVVDHELRPGAGPAAVPAGS